MEASSIAALDGMLAAERACGFESTYHVLGLILPDVRERIRADGHAVAFHSFNHTIERRGLPGARAFERVARRLARPTVPFDDQLARCRGLDYRIKGYRPPQSRIGPGLSDRNLLFYNFEWLASGTHSIGSSVPRLDNGIVKIPIHLDDFPLHRQAMSFVEWEARIRHEIATRDFVAFSLHDCYSREWLPHYRAFLDRIRPLGEVRTLDRVAADVTLQHAS
jgi:hypothetical protein